MRETAAISGLRTVKHRAFFSRVWLIDIRRLGSRKPHFFQKRALEGYGVDIVVFFTRCGAPSSLSVGLAGKSVGSLHTESPLFYEQSLCLIVARSPMTKHQFRTPHQERLELLILLVT